MKEREFAGMLYDAIRNRDLQDAVITVFASFVTSLLVSVILTLPAAVVTWLIWVLGGDAGLWLNVVSMFLKILIGVLAADVLYLIIGTFFVAIMDKGRRNKFFLISFFSFGLLGALISTLVQIL